MCDQIPGEIIMRYHMDDRAADYLREMIEMGKVPHFSIIESLRDGLAKLKLKVNSNITDRFYLLKVPPGEENFKINILNFHYARQVLQMIAHGKMKPEHYQSSKSQLQLSRNSILTLCATTPAPVAFAFTKTHDDYKKRLHFPSAISSSAGKGKKVLILDSGVDTTLVKHVVSECNFVDKTDPHATDETGHGTAVASIIQDLAPSAEIVAYKVADKDGRASEWDTCLALYSKVDANVINLSLAFGLTSFNTKTCGRESQSSRSGIFQSLIDQLLAPSVAPIIVAAAGNESKKELSFPARFDEVVAVESVDLTDTLSEFSNRSTSDQEGNAHSNVFALPGGQQVTGATDPSEYIGIGGAGKKLCGTSFSTAYASGLIAALWSQSAHAAKDSANMLRHIRANCDSSFASYNAGTYGNGIMQFV